MSNLDPAPEAIALAPAVVNAVDVLEAHAGMPYRLTAGYARLSWQ